MVYLGAYGPTRPEELAGLRRRDVDLDELRITVRVAEPERTSAVVGLPDHFRFYDLRHTGHTLSTRSGATLKDTMVRAGQSSEKAAMIYQHSEQERQREVAGMLDRSVRKARGAVARKPDDQASGTDVARGD